MQVGVLFCFCVVCVVHFSVPCVPKKKTIKTGW